MKKLFFTLLVVCTGSFLFAAIRLPRFFGDHMVLQRGQSIPVWGWADRNEKITLQLNKQTKSVTADKAGRWKINFDPELAGGPYQLVITGKESLVINDVLIGDVWICSGQSNMEWPVEQSKDHIMEIADANYPKIRHFKVPHSVSGTPREDISGGEWKLCTPAAVGEFTAVGYFFARELFHKINVPIGLLNTSWGGTHVETWTSRGAFENSPEFKDMIAAMPRLNLDSLAKEKANAVKKRIESLQGSLVANLGETEVWKDTVFNDAKWPTLQVPGLWENQTPGDFDGVLWLRKTVYLSPADVGKAATLSLAMIDDSDETYVNGQKVGSTDGYNLPRKYNLPTGLLKVGKNTIVVKVVDTGGGGGIWGEAADVYLSIDGKSVGLGGAWSYQIAAISETASGIGPNSYPTLLFNAMLNPLVPYAISGVIWYQGESNADRAYQYRKAFPLMIEDWRKQWKQGDFPFYFVQLASFNAANGNSQNGSTWAELREAQTLTLSLPNTGMAVTTDIGEAKDIHPRNKQDVGARLAALALNRTYSKTLVCSGPNYQGMRMEGNKIILSFSQVGGGLWAKDKYGYLKGFEIAGADQQFKYAKAWIQADQVVVFQDGVDKPVAVRFGWADDAGENNLFNKEGFPASPFRTDNWKGGTEEKKFKIGQ